ncbi:MAG: hypothetical protein V3U29_10365 [Phycisphaeraceae bacterium]
MPQPRPTFSESWYRVSELRPRLRSTVQCYRQHFRGNMWYVLRDPSNNQFFRINDASYYYVGLLDGRRTVSQAWEIANGQLGDRAPTQNEVIQLLGQLYAANLLMADLPADSAGLFERYRKKVRREIQGYLMNLLFVRVPLWDPDRTLDRWVGVVGWVFGPVGLVLWLILMAVAGWQLAGHGEQLVDSAQGVLDPNNLLWLYVAIVIAKALHELGHGFACKKYGRASHSGGEVHTIGIMFLVFIPVPYVDASSSWALRSKWQRAIIGAAGMFVELAVAAVAVVIWTHTGADTTLHAIAYNTLFIASVSTLLFNGNPLIRFDGYYILSDVLEIPNLAQRSKDYLFFLVKRYVFGTKHARHIVTLPSERPWLVAYHFASSIYRVFISIAILWFVSQQFFIIGVILALVAIVTWVVVPMGKFAHYLATHHELMRVRPRAVGATIGFLAALFIVIGLIPMPDRARAEGVVEPRELAFIHTSEDGFVIDVLPSGGQVDPSERALLRAVNRNLEATLIQLNAQRQLIQKQINTARTEDQALVQALEQKRSALQQQIDRTQRQLDALVIRAPFKGQWIAPQIEHAQDAYLRRGQRVGIVASLDDLIIRVAANQRVGPRIAEAYEKNQIVAVELRVRGRPDLQFTGTIENIPPAGTQQLPSAALGYLGGGAMAVKLDDPSGMQTTERFFEVWIRPDTMPQHGRMLLSGQRVVARFQMPPRPLLQQWWRAALQMVQRRLQK